MDYARGLSAMLTFPSDYLASGLYDAALHCRMNSRCPTVTRWAGDILRLALRTHLILKGRTDEPGVYHKALTSALEAVDSFLSCCSDCAEHVGPNPNMSAEEKEQQRKQEQEQCAFCQESPARAAITLSRCARCKEVLYCSVGCQKAHWRLHKLKCCKKECTAPGYLCKPTCPPGCPYKQVCMLSHQSKKKM